MKLLIITQKVDINDDVLGFMHGWIEEFARNCELVTVICLERGEAALPKNVKILSLGKESGSSKLKYIYRFYNYIFRERFNFEAVFVHMNPEYVVLGGLFWRLLRKKVSLWYAHGHTPASLKIAEKFANIIFTSTASGCRLKSRKIKVIGQGIDAKKFRILNFEFRIKNRNNIISIGRISPSKDYETLIKAVEILNNKGVKLAVEIVGGPATEADKKYFADLKELVKNKKLNEKVRFLGPIANRMIVEYLEKSALFANMGQTGSLDKAMAEAMAAELPVLTCNEAMLEVLGDFKRTLMYPKKDFQKLAERIEYILNLPEDQYRVLGKNLRNIIVKNHSLAGFSDKIIGILNCADYE